MAKEPLEEDDGDDGDDDERYGLGIGLEGEVWEEHTIASKVKKQLSNFRAGCITKPATKCKAQAKWLLLNRLDDAERNYAARFLPEEQACSSPWLLPD